MNIFEEMIQSVFGVPQFQQFFTAEGGRQIVTVSYERSQEQIYTQYGIDAGVTFGLTCKCRDYTPYRGAKIEFRGKTYKVDSWTTDSFGLTYRINLKDVTSK